MKIVYQDLINLLEQKPSIEDLSEKLFQLGHEHEVHGDILDMELTPNRGDCLSLVGLARDLNIFFAMNQSIDIYDGKIETLNIEVYACFTEPPDEISEDYVLINVKDNFKNIDKSIYKGWMISSSPEVTPLEHPIYDLWLLGCSNDKTS